MEHLVKLVDILAWPIVVLIVIFSLKDYLFELVPQLKKLKYKDLELEFEKELESLSKSSQESRSRIEGSAQPDGEDDDYIQMVRELSPRSAIMESWLVLETTAITNAQHFGLIQKKKAVPFHEVIDALFKSEVINHQDVENINNLRELRNKAVHERDFKITYKEAEKFLEISRDQVDIITSEIWNKFGGFSE